MKDNSTPDIREFSRTARRNILNALGISGEDPDRPERPGHFHDEVGSRMQGTFTFELIEADTGEVVQQVEQNTVVNEGENEILRWLAGLPRSTTGITFSGDGTTTDFQLPYPYFPIETVDSVTVGGNSQSAPADYAMDYWNGLLQFDSAPSSGTDNISVDVSYVQHPFRWLAVGTDGTSVSESDTSLGAEDTRIDLDPNTNGGEYTRDGSAVEITGTWLFGTGQANVSIAEAALSGMPSSAGASKTSDDTILNRTVVDPTIDKTSSQELKVTWTLSM
jgi:hypothetical protein